MNRQPRNGPKQLARLALFRLAHAHVWSSWTDSTSRKPEAAPLTLYGPGRNPLPIRKPKIDRLSMTMVSTSELGKEAIDRAGRDKDTLTKHRTVGVWRRPLNVRRGREGTSKKPVASAKSCLAGPAAGPVARLARLSASCVAAAGRSLRSRSRASHARHNAWQTTCRGACAHITPERVLTRVTHHHYFFLFKHTV